MEAEWKGLEGRWSLGISIPEIIVLCATITHTLAKPPAEFKTNRGIAAQSNIITKLASVGLAKWAIAG